MVGQGGRDRHLGDVDGGLVAGGSYITGANDNVNAQTAFGITALGSTLGLGAAWLATAGMATDSTAPAAAPSTAVLRDIEPTLLPAKSGAMLGVRGVLF